MCALAAFFTFERILGLVGPGSRAIILYAFNAAEIKKRGVLEFHVCQVKKYGKVVRSWTVQADVNRVPNGEGEHNSQQIVGSTEETLKTSFPCLVSSTIAIGTWSVVGPDYKAMV